MKRYVATLTIYVYGDTDQDALNKSQNICEGLKDKYDNHADTEQLHLQPHARLGGTKIDLSELNKYKPVTEF